MRQLVFTPLFSGSSGNATYISDGTDAVIADAGVSASRILSEIARLGLDASLVRAIVATHEHSDHVSGIGPLARKLNVPIYATRGTWEGMGRQAGKLAPEQKRVIDAGSGFSVGDMDILSFPTPHDALESCGYDTKLSVEEKLRILEERISCGSFPHEIGIFLGYPVDDVLGFIENKGANYLFCGFWKVYSNPRKAKRAFDEYVHCRDYLCDNIQRGVELVNAVRDFRRI